MSSMSSDITEGRPAREAKKKINYDLFNEFGRTRESDRSRASLESSEQGASFKPIERSIGESEILVRETPLTTPTDNNLGSAAPIIPKAQETGNEIELNRSHDSNMADPNDKSIFEEISEVDIETRCLAIEKEKQEMEKKAKLLADQVCLKVEERQLQLMKKQVQELMDAKKKASEAPSIWNLEALGSGEAVQQVKQMLDLLKKEEEERARIAEETRCREQQEQQKREQEEKDKAEQLKLEQEHDAERKKKLKQEQDAELRKKQEEEEKHKNRLIKLRDQNPKVWRKCWNG